MPGKEFTYQESDNHQHVYVHYEVGTVEKLGNGYVFDPIGGSKLLEADTLDGN